MRLSRRVLGSFLVRVVHVATLPMVAAAEVTVFAAASLKEAMDEQARRFEASTGDKVVVSYGASNALARQIEAGAPADMFVSADLDWMDYVDQRRLLMPNTRFDLLRNTLVLIAPASSKSTLKIGPNFGLATALGQEKLAMANPDSVPAGKYGKSALESLGVWGSVEKQVARAENVRAALALVARGEAPFGIVYATDAFVRPGREDRRYVSAGQLPADCLSGGAACVRQVDGGQAAAGIFTFRPRARSLGEIRVRVGSISHAWTESGRGRNPGAESPRRGRQRHLQSADRDSRRLRLGTVLLSRQDAGRRDRASAARAASGRCRLCAAGAVRKARSHWQPAQ